MAGTMHDAVRTTTRQGEPLWLRCAPAVFLVLWSGGFAFVTMGLAHAQPLSFLALRFALVVAVLLPLLVLLRPRMPATRAEWAHLALVGVLMQALYFGLAYLAMERISAGATALIVSLQPILVGLAVPRLTGEVVGAARWVGLALGLLGAAVVIVARSAVEAASVAGLVFAGAALLEDFRIEWTGDLVISLAYLVVGNSLISITLLLAMIRRGDAARVSALFFLVPPIAALIAWVLLGEAMPAPAWLGLGLAGLGVAIATRARPPS